MHKLEKDSIGTVKPGFHMLPPAHHTYGLPVKSDSITAKDSLFDWKAHQPSQKNTQPRDFLKLNKKCVIEGGSSAKDSALYRMKHDERQVKLEGSRPIKSNRIIEEMVFGIRNRPSTPIRNVVCHAYGSEVKTQRQSIDMKAEKQAVMKLLAQGKPKASLTIPRRVSQDYKLTKFMNVPSKVTAYYK